MDRQCRRIRQHYPPPALRWPLRIALPLLRVACDVQPDVIKGCVIPDDVLEVIVLKEPTRKWRPTLLAHTRDVTIGGQRLEGANDLPQSLPFSPLLYQDDPMEMVGHDNEGVQDDVRVARGEAFPDLLHHAAGPVGVHRAAIDVAEEAAPILGADGDVVATRLGVVVLRKAEGRTAERQPVCHGTVYMMDAFLRAQMGERLVGIVR